MTDTYSTVLRRVLLIGGVLLAAMAAIGGMGCKTKSGDITLEEKANFAGKPVPPDAAREIARLQAESFSKSKFSGKGQRGPSGGAPSAASSPAPR